MLYSSNITFVHWVPGYCFKRKGLFLWVIGVSRGWGEPQELTGFSLYLGSRKLGLKMNKMTGRAQAGGYLNVW